MTITDFPYYPAMMDALRTRESGMALVLCLSVIAVGLTINLHYHAPKLTPLIKTGALQGFLALLALGIALL